MRAALRIAIGFFLCFAQTAIAQVLPVNTVESLKRATVLVRHQALRSGFVFAREGGVTYVLTHARVVARKTGPPLKDTNVEFESGTPHRRSVFAEVVGFDRSLELAILAVEMEDAPLPIPFAETADLPVTSQVFVAGFLTTQNQVMPDDMCGVTISSAMISAIRRDKFSRIERLQLDGGGNWGNYGGAIVSPKGEVVGVAVPSIISNDVAYGIPIERVTTFLKGYVDDVKFVAGPRDPKNIILDVTVTLQDPMRVISEISLITAPNIEGAIPKNDHGGPSQPIKDGKVHPLVLKDRQATGRITFSKRELAKHAVLVQQKHNSKGSAPIFTRPVELVFPDDANAPIPPQLVKKADPVPRLDAFGAPDGPLHTEKSVKLAAAVEDLAIAGGGRYLVLKLRKIPALTIFDVFTSGVVGAIRLPSSRFVFGAGGNMALIHLPEENLLVAHELPSGLRRASKPNPLGQSITQIIMGHGRGDVALIRHALGTDEHSPVSLSLIGTERLDATDIHWNKQEGTHIRGSSYRDWTQFRSNFDLSLVTMWITNTSVSGVYVFARDGNQLVYNEAHVNADWSLAGPDNRIYTRIGQVFSDRAKLTTKIDGASLVPAIVGSYYFGVRPDGELTLYQCGNDKPLGPSGVFPYWNEVPRNQKYGIEIPADKRIIFLPNQGRIALVAMDDERIVLRPFDLSAVLNASGKDYVLVVSAPPQYVTLDKPLRYQIEALSKAGDLQFSVKKGPDNMTVSDSGVVSWTPSEPVGRFGEKVEIEIVDKSGSQTLHQFVLHAAPDN